MIDEILYEFLFIFSVNGVWLTADEFDCEESKACSGCCYGYPPATSRVVPTRQADLQLSCSKLL